MEVTTVLGRAHRPAHATASRRVGFRQRFVTSWAGFRGAVSLAAALAVPLTTLSGAPFPDRNLIIFVVVGRHPGHRAGAGQHAAGRRSLGQDARRCRPR